MEDDEDPKPLFVTDSGDLEVPYIGRFPAVGVCCKELARALKAELPERSDAVDGQRAQVIFGGWRTAATLFSTVTASG